MPTESQRKWIQALDKLSQASTVKKPLAPGGEKAPGAGVPGGRTAPGAGAPGGRTTAAPSGARLGGSVGAQGRNAKTDVLLVQAALNRHMNAGLAEDGACGQMTIGAILAFQKKQGLQRPDGRVDPGGPTERALNGGSGSTPQADSTPEVDDRSDGEGEDVSRETERVDPQDPEPDFPRLAQQIHDAAEGFGTDENAIFAALRELKGSRERRARLGQVYREMFGEDLEEVLRNELDDEEREQADDAASRGGSGEPDFESLARQIHAATEGFGTDEVAINAALAQVRGRPEHMARLRAVYSSMFGESLDDVLRGDLSGKELRKAQEDLDPRVEVIPDQGFDDVEIIDHPVGEEVEEE